MRVTRRWPCRMTLEPSVFSFLVDNGYAFSLHRVMLVFEVVYVNSLCTAWNKQTWINFFAIYFILLNSIPFFLIFVVLLDTFPSANVCDFFHFCLVPIFFTYIHGIQICIPCTQTRSEACLDSEPTRAQMPFYTHFTFLL